MNIEEILGFTKHNNVKFIRLAFCDIFGTLKNLAINVNELERAIHNGVEFDASAVSGFMNVSKSDLLLFPDLETMTVLPWRPINEKVVRFFCDIKHPDGTFFEGDGRHFLREAMEACEAYGYTPNIGIESEFYLFKLDEDGKPTTLPLDDATCFDVAPLDGGEEIRRKICLSLQAMGIQTKMSYHEKGPGQNVVIFEEDDALNAADAFISFKNCVKSVALNNSLYASFLPRPLENESGSGLRIKVSLSKNDRNIFDDDYEVNLSEQRSFIAGVLKRVHEISGILNPIHNSYLRLGREKAPRYITWAKGNKSQLLRVDEKEDEYSYIMLRSPDASCNPYYAYGLLLYAGIEGMKNKEQLMQGEDRQEDNVLPADLKEAMNGLRTSAFIASVMERATIDKILEVKDAEVMSEEHQQFDQDSYFKVI